MQIHKENSVIVCSALSMKDWSVSVKSKERTKEVPSANNNLQMSHPTKSWLLLRYENNGIVCTQTRSQTLREHRDNSNSQSTYKMRNELEVVLIRKWIVSIVLTSSKCGLKWLVLSTTDWFEEQFNSAVLIFCGRIWYFRVSFNSNEMQNKWKFRRINSSGIACF